MIYSLLRVGKNGFKVLPTCHKALLNIIIEDIQCCKISGKKVAEGEAFDTMTLSHSGCRS